MVRMLKSPAMWLRMAAVVTLVYAGLHTAGFSQSLSPEADKVAAAMKGTHVSVAGSVVDYWGLYFGFGLGIGLCLAAQAVLMWLIANRLVRGEAQVGAIVTFLVFNVANLGLLVRFFFLPPQVLTAVIIVLLAICLALSWRGKAGRQG